MKAFINLFIFGTLGVVHARYLGILGMYCYPYCQNRRVNVGARGVCANACFSVTSGNKPDLLTYNSHRGEDRGCSAFTAPGHRGVSPCGQYSTLAYKRTGNTCDEYPFAATDQSGGNTNPRSPAILRCVPGTENSSGGAQLVNFQNSHSAANGDTYNFGFWPPPAGTTIPFCSPSSGTNDGAEFKYNGGGGNNYVLARREEEEFAVVDSRASNGTAFKPVYQTSGGKVLVTFNVVEVGTQVWDDVDGIQTIEKKLYDDYADYITDQLSNPTVESRADQITCS